jgi:gluconate 2-dehydrogenase gamma chain
MQPLDEAATETLRAAVDRIIPPDDESPGGLEAGVADFLLDGLAPGGYFPGDLPCYEEGLTALDALARRMFGASFAAIGAAQQDTVLIQFAADAPAFFPLLVEQCQEGFYTSPAGQEMIGWRVTG